MPRIGLTTTADKARRLANTIVSDRIRPVLLPCIEVDRASDDVLTHVRARAVRMDWIIVTSARTVAVLWPDGAMPDVNVAVVGESTAEAVGSAGGDVDVVGGSGVADLVEQLSQTLAGAKVLFPHGSRTPSAITEQLRGVCGELVEATVYETTPVAPGDEPVDGVVFGSPSAIEGWCLGRRLDDVAIGVIGNTTRDALRSKGREPDVISFSHDFHLLIGMLARHFDERSPV